MRKLVWIVVVLMTVLLVFGGSAPVWAAAHAKITGGIHFHVPGGQSVESYEAELVEVFRHIARERPLRLVH